MATHRKLLILGSEHPEKGRSRIESVDARVVAATTAGDGTPINPKTASNEDSLAVVALEGGRWGAVVADSHFGAAAGEIVARGFAGFLDRHRGGSLDEIALGGLLLDLDDRVRDMREAGDRSETTALVCIVGAREVVYANVGDSRLFVIDAAGAIEKLTGDRTIFLGGLRPIRDRAPHARGLETGRAALLAGAVAVLASDGIDEPYSGLSTARVGEILAGRAPLEARVRRLMELGGLAANSGGLDNLSVIAFASEP